MIRQMTAQLLRFAFLLFLLAMSLPSHPASAAQSEEMRINTVLLEVEPLMSRGDFLTAYRRLWEAVQEHPDHAELNFQLGRAAFEIGRFEAAAAAFERVIIADPDAHRARLELGRTFFTLKSHLLAKREFEQVLAFNPPPMVVENIRRFLTAIEKEMSPHQLSGRIGLGWQYDSNVTAAPGSEVVDTNIGEFTLDAGSLPRQDTAAIAQFSLNHRYDPGQDGGATWQNALSFYHTSHKHETAYNLDVLSVSAGPGFARNGHRVHLPVTVDIIQLGNEPYGRYYGVAPSISCSMPGNLDVTLTGTLQRRDYPNQKERDSAYWSVEVTPRFFLLNGRVMLQGSAKYIDEEARENDQSNRGWEGSFGLLAQLPYEVVLYLQYGIRTADYREPQSLFANSRKDQENRTMVNLSKRLWRGLSLAVSYVYTRNHSNLDLYDYDRKQLTAMLSWEF